jgi:3-deoxy-D-manno-octulosonic-acid transferase
VVNVVNLQMVLYEISIRLLVGSIRVAAFFNSKAKKWVEGRKNWRGALSAHRSSFIARRTLWVHVASLGEFEQGRPVIEALKEQFPDWKIVLTFFSPSGYEIRKNYPYADLVCYLPADTRRNARDFLDLVKPDAAIFVKYDFWANYLFELKKRGIPTLLVSALFREKQPFFQWWGGFWRKMLGCFTHIFLQNQDSAKLLQGIGFQNMTVAGDTRVDRVLKIAEGAKENEIVKSFTGENFTFIAGSSWEADEALFLPVFQKPDFQKYKLIVAPHEPSEANVQRICNQVEGAVRYSQYQIPLRRLAERNDSRVLVIDNIGLLNTLYRYGTVAYIGGGFGKGIHNTLEPAAFGLPVIFGPKHEKFGEARQMVWRGGAFSVKNSDEFEAVMKKLEDPHFYKKASQAVREYLEKSRGATAVILAYLQKMSIMRAN